MPKINNFQIGYRLRLKISSEQVIEKHKQLECEIYKVLY